MATIRLNKALLLFVITAFISMQWSATHVHLAENHDHDGSHHQHDTQAHSHHLSSHHADVIDASHIGADGNVVELEQECSSPLPGWKKQSEQSFALTSSNFPSFSSPQHKHLRRPEIGQSTLSYLSYATIRPRAPPHFS
ncbi:hypothetical protein ACFL2V_18515 [Pseudomonadota bacterium]